MAPEPPELPPELLRPVVPDAARAWVEAEVGQPITGVVRLRGASTSALHRLQLADGSRVVLRRYVWSGFLVNEPEAPRREIDALRFAGRHGLAVPEVIAADPRGEAIGDGVPALLMSYLGGQPLAVPDVERLAKAAASIHVVSAIGLDHQYFRWYADQDDVVPPGSRQPKLWRRAAEIWRGTMPAYQRTLIHRDFHPGNVIWARREVAGVVDWVNACEGPAGCDVAHCRANLREIAGPAAGDRFVAAYIALTGEDLDPYWIIAGYLEHAPSDWTAKRIELAEPDLAAAVRAATA